jgi:hypothetical protein
VVAAGAWQRGHCGRAPDCTALLLILVGDLTAGFHEIGLQPVQRAHIDTDVIENRIHECQLGRSGPAWLVDDAQQFLQVGAASEAGKCIGDALDRLLQLVDVMRRFLVTAAILALVVTVVTIALFAVTVFAIVVVIALVFAIVVVAALVVLVVVVVLVLVFSCHDISPE